GGWRIASHPSLSHGTAQRSTLESDRQAELYRGSTPQLRVLDRRAVIVRVAFAEPFDHDECSRRRDAAHERDGAQYIEAAHFHFLHLRQRDLDTLREARSARRRVRRRHGG